MASWSIWDRGPSLTCGACSQRLQHAVEETPDVKAVSAEYDRGFAVIVPSRKPAQSPAFFLCVFEEAASKAVVQAGPPNRLTPAATSPNLAGWPTVNRTSGHAQRGSLRMSPRQCGTEVPIQPDGRPDLTQTRALARTGG